MGVLYHVTIVDQDLVTMLFKLLFNIECCSNPEVDLFPGQWFKFYMINFK